MHVVVCVCVCVLLGSAALLLCQEGQLQAEHQEGHHGRRLLRKPLVAGSAGRVGSKVECITGRVGQRLNV